MALTQKLLNRQVPKQHDTYSLPWQTFWICNSLLVGKCAIFLLYKPTLNGLLESDQPLHILH